MRRTHYQVCIWNAALEKDPRDLLPTDFGREEDKATKYLLPVTVAEGVALSAPDVLKLTRCGCMTDQPCATARYTCATAQLSCTIFCGYHGMEECCNRWTKRPALLKKIETVMWRTSLSVMTNMAEVLDSAYTEHKQRHNLYTLFTFTLYGSHFGNHLGFAYVVRHQG